MRYFNAMRAASIAASKHPPGVDAATTGTGHEHQVTRTFFDTRPCADDGVGYEITATVNTVEHETENAFHLHSA